MICKRCGNELPDNSRFCLACGALQPMVCPSCKAESRPGSRTCSGCGKKLPVSESTLKFYKRKKSPTEIAAKTLLVVGILLVLTVAVIYLVQLIGDLSSDDKPAEESIQTMNPEDDQAEVTGDPNDLPAVIVEDPVSQDKPSEEEPVEDETPEDTPEGENTPEEEDTPAVENVPEEEGTPEDENTPEEEDPTQSKPDPAQTGWYFPDSDERLLTAADIEGLSKNDLKIARNEIYARHGRRFNNPELQRWFDSCSWYTGTIDPKDFTDEMLNDVELANAKFLLKAEG